MSCRVSSSDSDSDDGDHDGPSVLLRVSKRLELTAPAGPRSCRDLFTFVVPMLRVVLESRFAATFMATVYSRVKLIVKYAGSGAEATVLYWIELGLKFLKVVPNDFDLFQFHAAFDSSRLSRRILSSFEPKRIRPQHIFTNVLDCHPASIRHELDAVAWPDAETGDDQQLAESLSSVKRILRQSGAYAPNTQAACKVHNAPCCPNGYRDPAADCDPFILMSGGMTCVDYSSFGKRQQAYGKSTIPDSRFSARSRQRSPTSPLPSVDLASQWTDPPFM